MVLYIVYEWITLELLWPFSFFDFLPLIGWFFLEGDRWIYWNYVDLNFHVSFCKRAVQSAPENKPFKPKSLQGNELYSTEKYQKCSAPNITLEWLWFLGFLFLERIPSFFFDGGRFIYECCAGLCSVVHQRAVLCIDVQCRVVFCSVVHWRISRLTPCSLK